jgi:uncharacterized protein YjbJ (UPF0337 family)
MRWPCHEVRSGSPVVADAVPLSGRWKEDAMNKDELKGKIEKAKGYVKEEVGEAIGDRDLEERGREQRDLGKAQEKIRRGSPQGG